MKASVKAEAAPATDVVTSLASGVNTVMGRIFDAVAKMLSSCPAGPVNDLLSGALLLTRRALFIPVKLDGAPTVTSLNLPNAGTYGTDGEMKFVVNFNEQVVVANTDAAVPVEMNYRLSGAKYVSGSGTQSLVFSMKVPQYAWDADGIEVGTVSAETGLRTFGWSSDPLKPLIVDKRAPTVGVDSTIPAVNTSRIRVDALGPQIIGRSGLNVDSRGVSLTVTFDRPVVVSGTPTVPVNIDGVDRVLTYSGGNRSDTLTFKLAESGIVSASFRPYTGDVIYLPEGAAGIRDKLGNQIYTLEGDIDTPLIENGNRLVVIGRHFERLTITGPDGKPRQSLSATDLDSILNNDPTGQASSWLYTSSIGPPLVEPFDPANPKPPKEWPFLDPSVPDFSGSPAVNSVDVYRVAFRSLIPEQQRITTAYGLAAIPTNAQGAVPVVVWQQATVFNLTDSAPSQAFSCGTTGKCPESGANNQDENNPPRFEVAQFAGKGYAVFIPDPFGLGNSAKYENYAYMVKGSIAQNSSDMYDASMQLLAARKLEQSHLFLAGWSAGGNQSADWLEKIESTGGTVDGVAIASSPLSLGEAVRTAIFEPRAWTAENTGDASWLDVSTGFSALSLGGYEGQPATALDLLGKYYDVARRLYTQQYTKVSFGDGLPYQGAYWGPDAKQYGVTVEYTDVNGIGQTAWMPYSLARLIVPKYATSKVAYDNSPYAQLMNANGSGRTPWTSPVYMQYGKQDEVLTTTMGRSVYSWQVQAYGKQNIVFVETEKANHVGNYLRALVNDLTYFDAIRSKG